MTSFKSSDVPFSCEVDVLKVLCSDYVCAVFLTHLFPNVLADVIILKVRDWSDTKHRVA